MTFRLPVPLLLLLFLSICSAQTADERRLFSYINTERSREELQPLQWNPDLYKVAARHSRDMSARNKASHTGSDGREPHERIREAGIFASKSAENIARDLSIVSAHTMLMQSLYHRENILDAEFTDAAVAVFAKGSHLYVTELFIRRVPEYTIREGRRKLVDTFNAVRKEKQRPPLAFSEALSNVAQSHVDLQQKFDRKTPLLTMSVLARQLQRSVAVNVYTTSDLASVPGEVRDSLVEEHQVAGIGFKRIRGSLCENGCYFVALILS